ncbi:MAG: exodeoxyribonuclease V subunit gamma [Kofleriaceae bacterium]
MLRAVHANRVEQLFAALLERLPPVDPFAPATIVVGSHLMTRWLTHQIAIARGIASGLNLITFDRFVDQMWADRESNLVTIDRARLGVLLASVLADDSVVRSLPQVAHYLDAAPDPGDRAGPRRVQLAGHLARLYWQYATTRPDWMPVLLKGNVPAELGDDPAAGWQATLLAAAFARLEAVDPARRYAMVPLMPWARRNQGLSPPATSVPVSVFGISTLARSELDALTDLSATSDVTVYVLDPCQELWDDIAGRRTARTTSDPLPLVLWGRPVRDTLAALVERTGGDLDSRFGDDTPSEVARQCLLHDVQLRQSPSTRCREAGVTVLACPNPRREIEVIASEIRALLDADPSLRAHEIAVWIAGDADDHLALAPSAFEAVGVPWHLIDAPIDDRGRIAEAVLALLELPTTTMTRRDLLRVMTHPAVLAGHPHVDPADWVWWTERLGIAHGADHRAHEGTYLESFPGNFHWDQGVRRLALGAFMVGERSARGPARIAGLDVAPEELRPDQQASAATYALMVRSLCEDAAWLARYEAPLARWAEVFATTVDAYLAARDAEAMRDLERVRGTLASLAHLDLDGRVLGFREARAHATRRLGDARADRGEPLAGGVMIAPVSAKRPLPARVAFVAGLDERRFPAGDRQSPLDLRRLPRPGDVSPRDRDRSAFLDVLLGARDGLYLSYVAVEAKSGQPLNPSSVIHELADALAPYLGAGSSREALAQITIRQPLHRFGHAGRDVVPAIERERWACQVRAHVRDHLRAGGHAVPDPDGLFALLSQPQQRVLQAALGVVEPPPTIASPPRSRPLTIANLRMFVENPIQAWAQAVLDLDELADDEISEQTDEPFHLQRPARAKLLRDVFAAQLRDPSTPGEHHYDRAIRDAQVRGQFPVGVFAESARVVDLELLRTWRGALGPIPTDVLRIAFGRSSSPAATLVPAIDIELAPGRAVHLVGQTELLIRTGELHTSVVALVGERKTRSPYHLRGAFDHLVLAAAGLAPAGHRHLLIDRDGKVDEVRHAPWTATEARNYLARLARELLDAAHGYLLPLEASATALTGELPAPKFRDPTKGIGYGPIDRVDGLDIPSDAVAIAQRRLRPLTSRMDGKHGFKG